MTWPWPCSAWSARAGRATWASRPTPAEVVDRLRRAALGVAGPLLGILGGTVAASVAAHQAQVGGLFAPGLLAPDPSRLWGLRLDDEGSGSGLAERAGRGLWSVAKAGVVVAVAAWAIRSDLDGLHRLGRLEPPALALASGGLMRLDGLRDGDGDAGPWAWSTSPSSTGGSRR